MPTESEKKLEAMLADFEKSHPGPGKNFRTLVTETPALKSNLLVAIDKGNLEKIGPPPANMAAGIPAAYVAAQNAIVVNDRLLDRAGKDPVLANTMRMIMTHESEHAVNKQAIEDSKKNYVTALETVAKGPSPHDYTAAVKAKGAEDRLREATDQIGGFNAVADHVHKLNPNATEQQLYARLFASSSEMQTYFDVAGKAPNQTYAPKAGLTLDKAGHMAETEENIKAMAVHFFDARPYPQFYARQNMRTALGVESAQQARDAALDPKYVAPEVRFNLKGLGIPGAALPPGVKDSSPMLAPVKPDDGTPFIQMPQAAPELPLHRQANAALECLGDQGVDPSQRHGAAAAIAAQAHADGLDRIDSILASRDGKGLIAMQGDPATDYAKHSYIDREQAMQQPLEQSLKVLEDAPARQETAEPAQQQTAQAR